MADDEAGPLLGWSMRTGMDRKRIHDLVEFPCTFLFKAVGVGSEGFVPALLERVAGVLGREVSDHEHKVRPSAKGRYLAVTLEIFVENGDQVYSIYEALQADERVRFML